MNIEIFLHKRFLYVPDTEAEDLVCDLHDDVSVLSNRVQHLKPEFKRS